MYRLLEYITLCIILVVNPLPFVIIVCKANRRINVRMYAVYAADTLNSDKFASLQVK